MATRPRKKSAKTIKEVKADNINSLRENLSAATENVVSRETLGEKGTSAKEAYEEFQRQAEAYRSKQWTANAGKIQAFPPQYHIHGQPYGSYHHHHASAPTGMPLSPKAHEGNQELLNKVGGMVRLGIDFINTGLAGGLSLMGGLSGQHACSRHHDDPHHGSHCDPHHGSHHGTCHPNYHDDCGPHGGCSCHCNDSHDYHHHDCCCHPQVRGCC
ncbi:MAG: hypothetical protein OEV42_03845 [Deltaproteobacteria bacterium]|nr:hypothetical protein [Deltaproteobacteria bacterium]